MSSYLDRGYGPLVGWELRRQEQDRERTILGALLQVVKGLEEDNPAAVGSILGTLINGEPIVAHLCNWLLGLWETERGRLEYLPTGSAQTRYRLIAEQASGEAASQGTSLPGAYSEHDAWEADDAPWEADDTVQTPVQEEAPKVPALPRRPLPRKKPRSKKAAPQATAGLQEGWEERVAMQDIVCTGCEKTIDGGARYAFLMVEGWDSQGKLPNKVAHLLCQNRALDGSAPLLPHQGIRQDSKLSVWASCPAVKAKRRQRSGPCVLCHDGIEAGDEYRTAVKKADGKVHNVCYQDAHQEEVTADRLRAEDAAEREAIIAADG